MAFRHGIVAFLFMLTGLGAIAQTISPETLLDINNKQIVGTETSVTYRGGIPAVLIEPTETPTADTEEVTPIPPPPPIPIHTPFGHERTAAFTDHTPDFVFLIQILDGDTIRVEEKIQLVNTQPTAFFQRVLPQTLSTNGNTVRNTKIELLNVTADNRPMSINVRDVGTALILTGNKPLSVGIHNVTISYLVHGAIYQNRSVADITLGLTGPAWPLLTERFSVVVLFPRKTEAYQKELLFGSNQVQIPEHFSVQVDENGNSVYQTTHILPAFSDVRLHMIVDAAAIPPVQIPWLQRISSTLIATLICLGIMLLYTMASIATLIYKKHQKPLQDMVRLNPILWQAAMGKIMTRGQADDLIRWQKQSGGKVWGISQTAKFLQHKGTRVLISAALRLMAFIRFNYEYIIGFTVLIGLTIEYAAYQGISFGTRPTLLLCGIAVVLAILIHRFGVRRDLRNLKNNIQTLLLQTPQGLNLATKTVATYYPYTVCLGFSQEWCRRLRQNNPAYDRLSFLTKEEKE